MRDRLIDHRWHSTNRKTFIIFALPEVDTCSAESEGGLTSSNLALPNPVDQIVICKLASSRETVNHIKTSQHKYPISHIQDRSKLNDLESIRILNGIDRRPLEDNMGREKCSKRRWRPVDRYRIVAAQSKEATSITRLSCLHWK